MFVVVLVCFLDVVRVLVSFELFVCVFFVFCFVFVSGWFCKILVL